MQREGVIMSAEIPAGYGWPGAEAYTTAPGEIFWLQEQPGPSATRMYMVVMSSPGVQRLVAERCYLDWAVRIVDALRAAASGPADLTSAGEGVSSAARNATVLHVLPDDVLLVGNLSGGAEAAQYARGELLRLLPSVRQVVVFASDIDVKVLREVEADALADAQNRLRALDQKVVGALRKTDNDLAALDDSVGERGA
jgi:hypothetical protein